MAPPTADTLLNRFTVKAKFRHMQVLLKLAELGTMRRAAEAVGMTQPAVSQMISELERLLDTQLFFRHARGVEVTDAARDLLPIAQRILEALEDGSEAVANRLTENEGVVRVTASPAAVGGLLHGRLASFAERYPAIQVHITEAGGGDELTGLAATRSDVICTRQPAVIPEGMVFENCLADELIAVCGKDHPFASATTLDTASLGEAKWLLNRVGSVARQRFEALSAKHGWPNEARCQVVLHIPALTRELLMTGKYLAILPRSVARPWREKGDILALDTVVTQPLAPLGALWREKTAGVATKRLVQFLQKP